MSELQAQFIKDFRKSGETQKEQQQRSMEETNGIRTVLAPASICGFKSSINYMQGQQRPRPTGPDNLAPEFGDIRV